MVKGRQSNHSMLSVLYRILLHAIVSLIPSSDIFYVVCIHVLQRDFPGSGGQSFPLRIFCINVTEDV